LADLVRSEVRFLVVGGWACLFNGLARSTEDIDVLVDAEPENVRRLLQALASFGEGHAAELTPADFTDEEGAIRLIEDFPLHMFVRMKGLHYADLLPYRRELDGEVRIPYVDASGLILLKSGSLRQRDQIDVECLKRIRDGLAP
jgi:hypothetical protein